MHINEKEKKYNKIFMLVLKHILIKYFLTLYVECFIKFIIVKHPRLGINKKAKDQ
jgi:hypothetical protein